MARIRSVHPDATRRSTIPASTRVELARRHGCPPNETIEVGCHYCGRPGKVHFWLRRRARVGFANWLDLEIDHVKPLARGGTNDLENLVLACRPCNRSKGCR